MNIAAQNLCFNDLLCYNDLKQITLCLRSFSISTFVTEEYQ